MHETSCVLSPPSEAIHQTISEYYLRQCSCQSGYKTPDPNPSSEGQKLAHDLAAHDASAISPQCPSVNESDVHPPPSSVDLHKTYDDRCQDHADNTPCVVPATLMHQSQYPTTSNLITPLYAFLAARPFETTDTDASPEHTAITS